jgi:hypothetical protein
MPITAKLSRRFYEALGDDIANELVDWFNAVDLTYRTELRELNDLNWSRYKAELENQIGTLRGEVQRDLAQQRMVTEALGGQLRTEMAVLRADLIKWMFLFWLGTIAVSIANRFF